jgi:hypothetical protein
VSDAAFDHRPAFAAAATTIHNQSARITELEQAQEAILRRAVAATLRTVAGWGTLAAVADDDGSYIGVNVTRAELIELAGAIETAPVTDWWSCPICEEVECDQSCPLAPLRTIAGPR